MDDLRDDRPIMLIVNPSAGRGQWEPLIRFAQARGDTAVHQTQQAGQAAQLARQAAGKGYQAVVAAGGDGTVHEVINGLAADFSAAALVIVPLGSANDLATTLEVPVDPVAAFQRVDRGRERRLDVVRVTDQAGRTHYLINAATGGFSTLVSEQMDDQTKQKWGGLAYMRAAMDAWPKARPHHLTIQIDDQPPHSDAGIAVVLCNGRFVGRLRMAGNAEPGDGRLELMVVTAQGALQQAQLLASYLLGQHEASAQVHWQRCQRVWIDAAPPMPFQIDGEPVGETPLRFEVLSQVLRVWV